ncbi:MAG: nucleotidyltransferase family protein [Pseudomonadota bacterium]
MNVVILAAGYATRLYPLTKDIPKALLTLGEKTIFERLVNSLAELPLTRVTVVSNQRFQTHFSDALQAMELPCEFHLQVNRSTHVDDRLGAVGDLALGLTDMPAAPTLVVAADTVFLFSFTKIWQHFLEVGLSTLCAWHNPDPEDRKTRGNVVVDDSGQVVSFVEKPAVPGSAWSAAPVYVFREEDLQLVEEYLDQGGNPDAPGHYVEWLCRQRPLSAWSTDQAPLDIGTHATLAAAREYFRAADVAT